MMGELKPIITAVDADAIREDIEAVVEGWYPTGRIDWEDLLDRIEDRGYDLGTDLTSPAIKRIKAIVKEIRAAE